MNIDVSDLLEGAVAEVQKNNSNTNVVSHNKIDELKEKLWQYKNAGQLKVHSCW